VHGAPAVALAKEVDDPVRVPLGGSPVEIADVFVLGPGKEEDVARNGTARREVQGRG
jgi:hypothetical protein